MWVGGNQVEWIFDSHGMWDLENYCMEYLGSHVVQPLETRVQISAVERIAWEKS
jgi:hypothetical protein